MARRETRAVDWRTRTIPRPRGGLPPCPPRSPDSVRPLSRHVADGRPAPSQRFPASAFFRFFPGSYLKPAAPRSATGLIMSPEGDRAGRAELALGPTAQVAALLTCVSSGSCEGTRRLRILDAGLSVAIRRSGAPTRASADRRRCRTRGGVASVGRVGRTPGARPPRVRQQNVLRRFGAVHPRGRHRGYSESAGNYGLQPVSGADTVLGRSAAAASPSR